MPPTRVSNNRQHRVTVFLVFRGDHASCVWWSSQSIFCARFMSVYLRARGMTAYHVLVCILVAYLGTLEAAKPLKKTTFGALTPKAVSLKVTTP